MAVNGKDITILAIWQSIDAFTATYQAQKTRQETIF